MSAPSSSPPPRRPTPTPSPGPPSNKCHIVPLAGPGCGDSGSFPRLAGQLTSSAGLSCRQAGGGGGGGASEPHRPLSPSHRPAGGRGRGCPSWKEPQRDGEGSPCPVLSLPAPRLHLRAPRSPFPHPFGSCWCIQDWPEAPPSTLPPPCLKFLQTKRGLQSLWQQVRRAGGGCPFPAQSVQSTQPSPSNSLPPPWCPRPGSGCQGIRTRLLRSGSEGRRLGHGAGCGHGVWEGCREGNRAPGLSPQPLGVLRGPMHMGTQRRVADQAGRLRSLGLRRGPASWPRLSIPLVDFVPVLQAQTARADCGSGCWGIGWSPGCGKGLGAGGDRQRGQAAGSSPHKTVLNNQTRGLQSEGR